MSKSKMEEALKPLCLTCLKTAVRMEFTTFAYWYCSKCKEEVKEASTSSEFPMELKGEWTNYATNLKVATPLTGYTTAPQTSAKLPPMFKPGDTVMCHALGCRHTVSHYAPADPGRVHMTDGTYGTEGDYFHAP